jgi:hypothetical protein
MMLFGSDEANFSSIWQYMLENDCEFDIKNKPIEIVLGVSNDYFDSGEIFNEQMNMERLNKWIAVSHEWSSNLFKNKLISSILHLDELSPHIHLLIVHSQNNLQKKSLPWKEYVETLNKSYSKAVEHLGILFTENNNLDNKNSNIIDYYPSIKNLTDIEYMTRFNKCELKNLPSFPLRLAAFKKRILNYYKTSISDMLKPTINLFCNNWSNIINEITFLKNNNIEIDKKNKCILKLIEDNKELVNNEKFTIDNNVFTIFSRLNREISPYPPQQFNVSENIEIKRFNESRLLDFKNDMKRRDVLSLVSYLNGYDDNNVAQSICELSKIFKNRIIESNLVDYFHQNIGKLCENMPFESYDGPVMSEDLWLELRKTVGTNYNVSEQVLQKFHMDGIIGSDLTGNIILSSIKPFMTNEGLWKKTYFRMNPQKKSRFVNLEEDKIPFFLPGEDDDITFTDCPIYALKLKYEKRSLTVMVLPYQINDNRLLPDDFLKNKKFYTALKNEDDHLETVPENKDENGSEMKLC